MKFIAGYQEAGAAVLCDGDDVLAHAWEYDYDTAPPIVLLVCERCGSWAIFDCSRSEEAA